MSVTQIAPRPVPMEAFRWDGSEPGAQAIALWLVESDGRSDWDEVRYHRETDCAPKLWLRRSRDRWGDDVEGFEVSTGEWVVRFGSLVLVLDQDAFGHYFTTTPTLVIQ